MKPAHLVMYGVGGLAVAGAGYFGFKAYRKASKATTVPAARGGGNTTVADFNAVSATIGHDLNALTGLASALWGGGSKGTNGVGTTGSDTGHSGPSSDLEDPLPSPSMLV